MRVVEELMSTAVLDNDLLIKNQRMGDTSEKPRDIEFLLYAETERAKLVANFISDYRYGKPTVTEAEGKDDRNWAILVIIHAPMTEHIVHTLSGFMVCLSQLYDLEYDGWGCVIQR